MNYSPDQLFGLTSLTESSEGITTTPPLAAHLSAALNAVYPERPADLLRALRDELLAASDWTQLSDAPITVGALTQWKTYRQALRDLPGNYSGAGAANWPTPPS